MLSEAERDFDTVITERAGQATEMTRSMDISRWGVRSQAVKHWLSRYAGVVTVSGDGGLYEVINGLYSRPDWPRVGQEVRVGIVPGGSGQWSVREKMDVMKQSWAGHAVNCSLLHHQAEKFSSELEVSALSLAHDKDLHHDIVECQTRHQELNINTTYFLSHQETQWRMLVFEFDVGRDLFVCLE